MATLGEIVEANAAERDAITDQRAAERERSRTKKQRQRERQREKARLLAIAEAERMELEAARRERLDEQLAPAVLRRPIIAADGRMIVGPRVCIVDGRAERALSLHTMNDPTQNLAMKPRERRAAMQLQADWHDVGAGLGVGAVDYLRSGGGGGGATPPGHTAMLDQIEIKRRLDTAIRHLGSFAPAVARVVLDCIPISVWSVEAGLTVENARTWILAGLSRLATGYWPPKPEGTTGPVLLTFGPARETYDTGVDEE